MSLSQGYQDIRYYEEGIPYKLVAFRTVTDAKKALMQHSFTHDGFQIGRPLTTLFNTRFNPPPEPFRKRTVTILSDGEGGVNAGTKLLKRRRVITDEDDPEETGSPGVNVKAEESEDKALEVKTSADPPR